MFQACSDRQALPQKVRFCSAERSADHSRSLNGRIHVLLDDHSNAKSPSTSVSRRTAVALRQPITDCDHRDAPVSRSTWPTTAEGANPLPCRPLRTLFFRPRAYDLTHPKKSKYTRTDLRLVSGFGIRWKLSSCPFRRSSRYTPVQASKSHRSDGERARAGTYR